MPAPAPDLPSAIDALSRFAAADADWRPLARSLVDIWRPDPAAADDPALAALLHELAQPWLALVAWAPQAMSAGPLVLPALQEYEAALRAQEAAMARGVLVPAASLPAARARAELARLPSPLARWALALVDDAERLAMLRRQPVMAADVPWPTGVSVCWTALAGRYPFVPLARAEAAGEALPGDLLRWLNAASPATAADPPGPLPELRPTLTPGWAALRDAFYPGGHPAGPARLQVLSLGPGVAELRIEQDGQAWQATPGADLPAWLLPAPPAPALSRLVLSLRPADDGPATVLRFEGPWSGLRLVDAARVTPQPDGSLRLTLGPPGREVQLGLRPDSRQHPWQLQLRRGLSCPP